MELALLFGLLIGAGALFAWGDGAEDEITADLPEDDEGDALPSLLDEQPIRLALSDELGAEVVVEPSGLDAAVTANGETVITFPDMTVADAADRMDALAAAGAFADG